jgi:hypothetical protein
MMLEREDYAGAELITDTTVRTGRFGALQAVAAAVLDTGTVVDYNGDAVATLPIPVGTTIYGTFTAVKLSSGKVIAYRL